MSILFSPDQASVVTAAIRAGLIANASDLVDLGVEAVRHRLEEGQVHATRRFQPIADTDQWLREFHAWVHGHSTDTPLLSDEAISRDSIYGPHDL